MRGALAELDRELERHRLGRGAVGRPGELETFRGQLLAMEKELLEGEVSGDHVGMGRAIVDSWPWDVPLGEILLDAEQKYREAAGPT